MEQTEVKEYQKNVVNLSRGSFDKLLLNRKVREPAAIIAEGNKLFKLGKLNACECILAAIEVNPSWSMHYAKKKIRFYTKEVKSFSIETIGRTKTFSPERAEDYLKKRYLNGEEVGSQEFLKRYSSQKNREEGLGEGHLLIIDLNNSFVEEYEIGQKIDINYFTDKYIKNPDLYFQ